jgi:hypothetical protein
VDEKRLEVLKRIYDYAVEHNDMNAFMPADDFKDNLLIYQYLKDKGYIYTAFLNNQMSVQITSDGMDLIETGRAK